MLLEQNLSLVEEDGGVDGWLAALSRGWQGNTNQDGRGEIACGLGKLVDDLAAASQETGFLKKIGRRITANGKLGEDSQPRTGLGRLTAKVQNLVEISGEISYGRIDLGKCYLHTSSLVHGIAWAGTRVKVCAFPP